MQTPPIPIDEATRLATLVELNILDTEAEERFDRVTRLARRLFDVPVALVSLVDAERQWFKSCQGLDTSETARDVSFCGHAILSEEILVIPDASRDKRFCGNPLVIGAPFIRFYAGCPLTMADGSRVGTFCVIDRKPRQFGDDDLASLRDLAQIVERELGAVKLATVDELTLISNRRAFDINARHALSLCRRLSRPASLLYIDLDHFKQINDRFGHAEGDLALSSFAQLLQQTFRESDLLGRRGGDEFAVLLTNASEAELSKALRRLRQAVDRCNQQASRGYEIGYTVGAVMYDPARHASFTDLINEADALMYARKTRSNAGGGPPMIAAG